MTFVVSRRITVWTYLYKISNFKMITLTTNIILQYLAETIQIQLLKVTKIDLNKKKSHISMSSYLDEKIRHAVYVNTEYVN